MGCLGVVFLSFLALCLCRQSVDKVTNDVNLDRLTEITLLSYAASCRENLTSWTCFWCTYNESVVPFVNVSTVFKSDGLYGTYGYIGLTTESLVMSFRGSASLQNWIHDFDVIQVRFPDNVNGSKVHRGFYTAYKAVIKTIYQHIKQLRQEHPTLPLTITGHSLGAALAVIAATDLINSGIIPGGMVSVATIGQPRVGNKLFAQYFNSFVKEHYRIVNKGDIVPHLPPQIFGYRHTGTEIWFSKDYVDFVICDGSGEDKKCSDSLRQYAIQDHLHYLGIASPDGKPHECGGGVSFD